MRKIIHCDCDSFYASVEMRDDPGLRDVPVAVGGRPGQRGVVATCNYNARDYGIHSAMPMSQAIRKCPGLVIVPANMQKYKAESAKVQRIFRDYTSLVEPLSLDEAYLDVTDCPLHGGSATLLAKEIRQRVKTEIGITISAGIAPNKFLAKIASDWNKPDGQFTIKPASVAEFVFNLPVNKLFGVGSVTAARMNTLNLHTCGDLQALSVTELTRHFGKFGLRLHDLCNGIDHRDVQTHRVRKSLSAERTYAQDLPSLQACMTALQDLVQELETRIDRAQCRQSIIQRVIKVRFTGFETTTVASSGAETQFAEYEKLLTQAWERKHKPVRLIGVGVRLNTAEESKHQLSLFDRP